MYTNCIEYRIEGEEESGRGRESEREVERERARERKREKEKERDNFMLKLENKLWFNEQEKIMCQNKCLHYYLDK